MLIPPGAEQALPSSDCEGQAAHIGSSSGPSHILFERPNPIPAQTGELRVPNAHLAVSMVPVSMSVPVVDIGPMRVIVVFSQMSMLMDMRLPDRVGMAVVVGKVSMRV